MTLPAPMTIPRPGWQDAAACRGSDTNEWFPVDTEDRDDPAAEWGGGYYPQGTQILERICNGCPVLEECLIDALATGDVYYGFRGALTPRPRAALLAAYEAEASSAA